MKEKELTARDFILREYPSADFDCMSGVINANMWRAVESLMERYYLERYTKSESITVLDAYSITAMVSAEFNVNPSLLKTKLRNRELVLPRHTCMFLMDKYLNLTYKQIGGYFLRDHSTVCHAKNKVNDYLETDQAYVRQVEHIEHKINSILNES